MKPIKRIHEVCVGCREYLWDKVSLFEAVCCLETRERPETWLEIKELAGYIPKDCPRYLEQLVINQKP